MTEPFLYPEDRSELFEHNEEEAVFYFTLSEFDQLIERYGADFVVARMKETTFEKLSGWFFEDD